VKDLEAHISEATGIPQERLVMLLRHEQLMSKQVRTELFNMDWRKTKSLEEAARFDHG